ncbi:MAG: prepilin-type N-terminal cleavage/methylation domain-containing protein, partial [bacterium]|nr:prepilin-type N-terminal cleavage/methylation domain-containing protein [bacterium]
MILPTGAPPSAKWIKPNAFTFIELIIVMAMLSALLAISAPMMSRFFRGQSIRDEARKVVALTEYARSQAVTLSIPIKIWIN